MTILIIVAILIAFAYIFGKKPARVLVLGSGALVVGLVILGVLIGLGFLLWDVLQTSESAQKIVGMAIMFVVIGVGSVTFESLHKRFKSLSSERQKEITRWVYGCIGAIILGLIIYWSSGSSDITAPESDMVVNQDGYKYFVKETTNVRSCGSPECEVVGQYPAWTSFTFPEKVANGPDWIEISWVDNAGVTKTGYIHKSTLGLPLFDEIKMRETDFSKYGTPVGI